MWKKKALGVLKAVIGLSLLGYILTKVNAHELRSYFNSLRPGPLAFYFILSAVSMFLQFLRWKDLVESNTTGSNVRSLIAAFFAGFTFRMLVPGGYLEGSKIFLLPGRKRGKIIAFGIEKFFQTFIKLFLITIALPFVYPQYRFVSVFLGIGLVLAYFIIPSLKKFKGLQEKPVNNHIVFVKMFGTSLIVFAIIVLQYQVLLTQSNSLPIVETGLIVIFIYGASLIPLSISGLGIREGVAVYLFARHGIVPAHAVATSLFMFAVNNLLPALIGAAMIYKNRKHLSDIPYTVKSGFQIMKSLIQTRKKSGGQY